MIEGTLIVDGVEIKGILNLSGGPQGPKGEKGDVGNQGAIGPQGEKGDLGNQGPIGLQGLQGDTGDTGADSIVEGPQGEQGAQGIQGIQGDTGADSTVAGPQGEQGLQGIAGVKGDLGDTGTQGIQGVKGDTGVTGAQGLQGITGDTGPQGEPGNDAGADTAAEVLAKLITVDGDGSGLDADRLRNFLTSVASADNTIPVRNQFGQLRSKWLASDNNVENGIHFLFDFTDRPWSFSQGGTGTSASLDLLANTSANSFRIGTDSSRDEIVINPLNGNITTQGSFIGDGSQLTNLPIPSARNGLTTFLLDNHNGYVSDATTANAATTYTITGTSVINGHEKKIINAATEPTVTGATKQFGPAFQANTDMWMITFYDGVTSWYYFLRIT